MFSNLFMIIDEGKIVYFSDYFDWIKEIYTHPTVIKFLN